MNFRDYLPWTGSGRRKGISSLYDEGNPISALQRQMNNLMEDFFSGFSSEGGKNFVPKIDVSEDREKIYVSAELPGLSEKDVEVSLTSDALTIRGEKKSEREEREGQNKYFIERSYGFFQRTIPLSAEIDEHKIDAVFKHGVLRVTLTKSQAAQSDARKIPIRQSE